MQIISIWSLYPLSWCAHSYVETKKKKNRAIEQSLLTQAPWRSFRCGRGSWWCKQNAQEKKSYHSEYKHTECTHKSSAMNVQTVTLVYARKVTPAKHSDHIAVHLFEKCFIYTKVRDHLGTKKKKNHLAVLFFQLLKKICKMPYCNTWKAVDIICRLSTPRQVAWKPIMVLTLLKSVITLFCPTHVLADTNKRTRQEDI